MNFLAHCFLSGKEEEILVGNFLADFIKNRGVKDYSPGIRQGIYLHRAIDHYTDQHPLVKQGVKRLRQPHGKYAPVVIDIFYDFILSKHWNDYSDQPLPSFRQQCYRILERYAPQMPPWLRPRLAAMIGDDWLQHYSTYKGMEETFRRLQTHVAQPAALDHATATLQREEAALTQEFHGFFPELIDYVKGELALPR